jgi:hypothetical protein
MFTNQLSEYSVGRAMNNDIKSVMLCRDMVMAINGCLIAFDFRNGPLRRKYDGLKYALKTIEDLLFEQSLLNDNQGSKNEADENEGNIAKKSKLEDTDSNNNNDLVCVDVAEFDVMRKRYEEVSLYCSKCAVFNNTLCHISVL